MEQSAEKLAVYEQAMGNESTEEQALTQTAGKCISKPGLSCLLVQIPGDEGRLMRYAQKMACLPCKSFASNAQLAVSIRAGDHY